MEHGSKQDYHIVHKDDHKTTTVLIFRIFLQFASFITKIIPALKQNFVKVEKWSI